MKKLILLFMIVFSFVACNSGKNNLSTQLLDEILSGNWASSYKMCSEADEYSTSIIYDGLKAHVFLANNYNDKSFNQFLKLNSPDSLKRWLKFAKSVCEKNKGNAIAYYLYGDAIARSGDYQIALDTLFIAQKLCKDNFTKALINNVIGLIKNQIDQSEEAINAFEKAISADATFADSYYNLGSIYLDRNNAEGAYLNFDIAIIKSNGFLLALNGRACAGIIKFEEKHFDQSIEDFNTIFKSEFDFLKAITAKNLLLISTHKNIKIESYDPVGMSTKTTNQLIEDYTHNLSWDKALGYLPKNLPWGAADGVIQTTKQNLDMGRKELKSRNVDVENIDRLAAGGVSTWGIEFATVDKGDYEFHTVNSLNR